MMFLTLDFWLFNIYSKIPRKFSIKTSSHLFGLLFYLSTVSTPFPHKHTLSRRPSSHLLPFHIFPTLFQSFPTQTPSSCPPIYFQQSESAAAFTTSLQLSSSRRHDGAQPTSRNLWQLLQWSAHHQREQPRISKRDSGVAWRERTFAAPAFLQAFVYLLTFLMKCLEYIFDVFQIRRQAFALTHPNNQDSSCKFLLRATTLIVSFSICQPTWNTQNNVNQSTHFLHDEKK